MRLNKYLALCGLGSRRAVEQLILAGQITVNGGLIAALGTQVDEARDVVEAAGRPVRPVSRRDFDYIVLNKPKGYDVTRGGRQHHRRAWDLLPKNTHPSVQSVGRLDRDSTGLLLFTNDGELAFRLTHPRFGCRKEYEVEIEGKADGAMLDRLREGVELEDGPARALQIERIPVEPGAPARLRIVIAEGRNRIVRRMCEAVGRPVLSLNRTALGPLTLVGLPRGKTRPLAPREIARLRQSVGLGKSSGVPPSGGAPLNPPRPTRKPAPPIQLNPFRRKQPEGAPPTDAQPRESEKPRKPPRPMRQPARPIPFGPFRQKGHGGAPPAQAKTHQPQPARKPPRPRHKPEGRA